MVTYCCVPGCKTSARDPKSRFHRFPFRSKELVLKWECVLGIQRKASKAMVVCARHFRPEDYRVYPEGVQCSRRPLRHNALPSQHLPTAADLQIRKFRIMREKLETEKPLTSVQIKQVKPKDLAPAPKKLPVIKMTKASASSFALHKSLKRSSTTNRPIITAVKAEAAINSEKTAEVEDTDRKVEIKIEPETDSCDTLFPSSENASNFSSTNMEEKKKMTTRENHVLKKRSSSVGSNSSSGSTETCRSASSPKKRKVEKPPPPTVVGRQNDCYCWVCHKENIVLCCISCPRAYHFKCAGQFEECEEWICPECCRILKAENVDNLSPVLSRISLDQFCTLLKLSLNKIKYRAPAAFHQPVPIEYYPAYPDYVINPMDLSQIEKNIKQKSYGCTESFLADVKWILHNSCVFNGTQHPLSANAKSLVKTCEYDMGEIEVCSDCFLHACVRNKYWFSDVCQRPHSLVWAKLKGFPYWPAKVVRIVDGNVDARFFGAHDRAWVPVSQCYHLSKEMPTSSKPKKKGTYETALDELNVHVHLLMQRFGTFEYAPYRTLFDPNDKLLCFHGIDIDKVVKMENTSYHAASLCSTDSLHSVSNIKQEEEEVSETGCCHTNDLFQEKDNSINETSSAISLSCESSFPLIRSSQLASETIDAKLSIEKKSPPVGVFEVSNKIQFEIPSNLKIDNKALSIKPVVSISRKDQKIASALERIKEIICSDNVKPERETKIANETFKDQSVYDDESKTSTKSDADSKTSESCVKSQQLIVELEDSCCNAEVPKPKVDDAAEERVPVLSSKKSDLFALKLDETIESCKAKLGITEIVEDESSDESCDDDADRDESSSESDDEDQSSGVEEDSRTESFDTDIEELDEAAEAPEESDECMIVENSECRVGDVSTEAHVQSDEGLKSNTENIEYVEVQECKETEIEESEEKETEGSEKEIMECEEKETKGSEKEIMECEEKETTGSEKEIMECEDKETKGSEKEIKEYEEKETKGSVKEIKECEEKEVVGSESSIGKAGLKQKLIEVIDIVAEKQSESGTPAEPKETSLSVIHSIPGSPAKDNIPEILDCTSKDKQKDESDDNMNSIDSSSEIKIIAVSGNFGSHPTDEGSPKKDCSPDLNTSLQEMPAIHDGHGLEIPDKSIPCNMLEVADKLQLEIDEIKQRLSLLRKEYEKQQWFHAQENAELQHNLNLIVMEMRASLEADKRDALQSLQKQHEADKNKCIEETKIKQWCANCRHEAVFLCCWNTSYCSHFCQKHHWPKHMHHCKQIKPSAQAFNSELSKVTNSKVDATEIPDSHSLDKKVIFVNVKSSDLLSSGIVTQALSPTVPTSQVLDTTPVSQALLAKPQIQLVTSKPPLQFISPSLKGATSSSSHFQIVPTSSVQILTPLKSASEAGTKPPNSVNSVFKDSSEIITRVRSRQTNLKTAIAVLKEMNKETAATTLPKKDKSNKAEDSDDEEEIHFKIPDNNVDEVLAAEDDNNDEENDVLSDDDDDDFSGSLSNEDGPPEDEQAVLNDCTNDKDNGDMVDIADGIELKAKSLNRCLAVGKTPAKLTRLLMALLFPDISLLARSCVFGRRSNFTKKTRPALPTNLVQAIIKYVKKIFPEASRSEIVLVMNLKCKEARRTLLKTQEKNTSGLRLAKRKIMDDLVTHPSASNQLREEIPSGLNSSPKRTPTVANLLKMRLSKKLLTELKVSPVPDGSAVLRVNDVDSPLTLKTSEYHKNDNIQSSSPVVNSKLLRIPQADVHSNCGPNQSVSVTFTSCASPNSQNIVRQIRSMGSSPSSLVDDGRSAGELCQNKPNKSPLPNSVVNPLSVGNPALSPNTHTLVLPSSNSQQVPPINHPPVSSLVIAPPCSPLEIDNPRPLIIYRSALSTAFQFGSPGSSQVELSAPNSSSSPSSACLLTSPQLHSLLTKKDS